VNRQRWQLVHMQEEAGKTIREWRTACYSCQTIQAFAAHAADKSLLMRSVKGRGNSKSNVPLKFDSEISRSRFCTVRRFCP
jgi:hypothetical protein